jgi:hypothetical protein
MKDIMQKLAELEATAPKVSKKQMLNEDSTTPPMNVSSKPASLKDMFENMAAGTKQAIPVVGKQGDTQQTGAGFLTVTDNSPAAQVLQKAVSDLAGQNKAQIVVPTTPQNVPAGAGAAGVRAVQTQQQQGQQQGQMQMTEEDAEVDKEIATIRKIINSRKGKAYTPNHPEKQETDQLRRKLAKLIKTKEVKEGAKVDRMVKHIEKSEKKSGKSKDEAQDIAWATANKRGMLDNKNKKKVKEGDIAPTHNIDTKGAGLGAGRSQTTLEGKKPDFLDLDKDGNKKESMKKAAADKKKQKVKEGMNHRINAARLEGKTHGLRGNAHYGKAYEDMDEMRAYHEGYKEGLDECYGQGVYEETMPATVTGMDSSAMSSMPTMEDEMEEGIRDNLKKAGMAAALGGMAATGGMMAKGAYDYHKKDPITNVSSADMDKMTYRIAKEDEMEEGNAFTAALAKTPKGGKFSVGGKTYTDRTNYDTKVDEYAFEAWDRELNNLLNEGTEVSEGLSVSVSKGQQNSPDSVTITAQDGEAEELLKLVKHAGLGLFGDEESEPSSAMSVQPSMGEPDEVGSGGVDIDVVDGHDGMLGLMQKLSGIQSVGGDDYEDEQEDTEQLYGNHEETHEQSCNECGGMMEAGHSCGSKMDEDETEDQMEFEVAEDNAPDSDEAETSADEDAEAEEDKALAGADSGDEEEIDEGFTFESIYKKFAMLEGSGDKPKHPEHDEKDDKDFDDAEEEDTEQLDEVLDTHQAWSSYKNKAKSSAYGAKKDAKNAPFGNMKADKTLSKRLAGIAMANKKLAKDPYFGKGEEPVNEWANQTGKGPGKGTDAQFTQDIEFMTKVISGGLNKPKSTGQTTVPVIAGQTERMSNPKETVTESVSDWVKLAGIK